MRILILGKGYLGTSLETCKNTLVSGVKSIHLSNAKILSITDVDRELLSYQPDIVINTIAKTGIPNVDWCESNKSQTLFSNSTVPLMILSACQQANVQMVHIGTGCLYRSEQYISQKNRPKSINIRKFSENDQPNSLGSYYSKTKYYADCLLAENDVLILRPRQIFDGSYNERNLIYKLVKYEKLITSQNSMTYMPDLIEIIFKLISDGQTGIFNVVNPGSISPYKIMCLYQKIVDSSHGFEMIESIVELDSLTKTPRTDCVLDTTKLEQTVNQSIPNVTERVIESLQQLKLGK